MRTRSNKVWGLDSRQEKSALFEKFFVEGEFWSVFLQHRDNLPMNSSLLRQDLNLRSSPSLMVITTQSALTREYDDTTSIKIGLNICNCEVQRTYRPVRTGTCLGPFANNLFGSNVVATHLFLGLRCWLFHTLGWQISYKCCPPMTFCGQSSLKLY